MERKDQNLAFMLQYENVAWFEDGKVRILDRRIYPIETKFVTCNNHHEVAQAITDMVTQSAGPYTAAGMGMALAAHEVKGKAEKEQLEYLKAAAHEISHARPTTANRLELVTKGCVAAAEKALGAGEDVVEAIMKCNIESLNRRYGAMEIVGEYLAETFPENGTVLTQCFGEIIVGMMLRAARKNNNEIKVYCTETRPYLQGARLTASVCRDMGFDTTVITDNMIAYTMERKGIDVFTSATDTITLDGYVANKIGTFQIAILAKHFGIPYYVTGMPDAGKKTGSDIIIEERNPEEVLSCHGIKHTFEGVKGMYPSFDVTPPELITGFVTDKGIYVPEKLHTYFDTEVRGYY